MTAWLRYLVLLVFPSVVKSAFYSSLLPGFACALQDATCAALGDLFASTNGPTWASTGTSTAAWVTAADGAVCCYVPTTCELTYASGAAGDYCALFGVTCDSNGEVVKLCVL